MNNYEFWEKYLKDVKSAVRKICREKSELHIDLHIHSNYSADGKQSLNQILETTKEKGFDIISITDHDTLKVYDELYEIVKNGITTPIIIPGIEFTVDNREYGNQCHMLQLFVNPKDPVILKDVSKNSVLEKLHCSNTTSLNVIFSNVPFCIQILLNLQCSNSISYNFILLHSSFSKLQ
jgi:hypothetical protein